MDHWVGRIGSTLHCLSMTHTSANFWFATEGLLWSGPSTTLASSSPCISISPFSGYLCISSPWKARPPPLPGESLTSSSRAEAIFTICNNWDGTGITNLYSHTPGSWLNIRFVLDSDPRLLEGLLGPVTPLLGSHGAHLGSWLPRWSHILPLPTQALCSSHSKSLAVP